MKQIKVSIIVPVYRVEDDIENCIASIARQTLQEIEIFLIDDGSPDLAGAVCDRCAACDERIHVIHKENGGVVSARNEGVKRAQGKYICFVDGDDWIEENMVKSLYEKAEQTQADVVAEGMIEEIAGSCKKVNNCIPAGDYDREAILKFICPNMLSCEDYFCLGVQPYLWNKLFRRGLAQKWMPQIDESIHIGEDAGAVYLMIADAQKLVISEEAHYHYCQHAQSAMYSIANEEDLSSMKLYHFMKGTFAQLGMGAVMRKPLTRYTVNNLLTQTYGRYAALDAESLLFPYQGILKNESIVIYGAGALGRAIYSYAIQRKDISVKAWVDQKARDYQALGMPVMTLDELLQKGISSEDKILIAVFREKAKEAIEAVLLHGGILQEQIKWIAIAHWQEEELLQGLEQRIIAEGD